MGDDCSGAENSLAEGVLLARDEASDLEEKLERAEADRDREKVRADTMTAECAALRAVLEEVRGASSTCGYDWGNSRIHKLVLEALAAAPETAKVSAVLEAAHRLCAVWYKGPRAARADGELTVESTLAEAVCAWRGEAP